MLQRFEFMMQIPDPSASCNSLVKHRTPRHFLHILAKIAYGEFLRSRDIAVIGLFFPDNHAEETGLARTIGSDQTNFFTGVELECCVYEENLTSVLFADARKGDHRNFLG